MEIVIPPVETGNHGFNRENSPPPLINISIIREEGRDSKRPRKDFHFITSREEGGGCKVLVNSKFPGRNSPNEIDLLSRVEEEWGRGSRKRRKKSSSIRSKIY